MTADKAYGFLDEALEKPDQPFFLAIAPIAPHADMVQEPYSGRPPKYAERHSHLFKDYKIPRTENFNPEKVCPFPRLFLCFCGFLFRLSRICSQSGA